MEGVYSSNNAYDDREKERELTGGLTGFRVPQAGVSGFVCHSIFV